MRQRKKSFFKRLFRTRQSSIITISIAAVAVIGIIVAGTVLYTNKTEMKEQTASAEKVEQISKEVEALYADDSKEMLAEDATMEKVLEIEEKIADEENLSMDSDTAEKLDTAIKDLDYAKSMIDLRDSAAALLDANGALVEGADIASVEAKATELQPDKSVFVESQMLIINEAKAQEQQILAATTAVTALFSDEARMTVRDDVTREELNQAIEQVALIKQEKAKAELTASTDAVDQYLTQKEAQENSSSNGSGSNNSGSNNSGSNSNTVQNPTSMLVLVNTQNTLPSSYVPPDLTVPDVYLACTPGSDKSKLRSEAASAMESMFAAAEAEGLQLSMVSGYRSYDRQAELFADEVADCGGDEVEAAKTVARPGTSEHQTGLAVDISSPNFDNQLEEGFGSTPEGIWLQENAHKYGFILRYPDECTPHTGIYYEPWHYRYVGVEAATDIYNQGICLEEYLQ